jgi:anthranilate/para-aminobenzoate synthase component II
VAEDTINQEELEITARSEDDDLVMALQHKKYKVHGIQFHPESIMTEYGHQMLKNFVELTG